MEKAKKNKQSKILSAPALKTQLVTWRNTNQKIVFTNGCFDLLHYGHIIFLEKARSLGNRLIVGLNTDASIQSIKGPLRPIKDEQSRSAILAAMTFVDAVVLFNEKTPINLIKCVMPDILVKGGDYKINEIVGHELVQKYHGKVCTVDFVPGYSSSQLIKAIKEE